ADRTGANTGQHSSGFPRATQQRWNVPFTPHREHALGVAAANVDHVLLEQDCFQIGRAREQRNMRRPAGELSERVVEAVDIRLRITGCSGEEAHGWMLTSREAEDEVIERRIIRLHREATSAHRYD